MLDMPDYKSKTFMLIDDETFMLGLVDRILKQCGAGKVLRATNGAAALAMFNGSIGPVDCVIVDLNMKPMNGLEFLKAVRTGVGKFIPRDQRVVMLTGHGDMDAVTAAGELDINGYILKPVSTEKLISTLERVMNHMRVLKDADEYRAVMLPDVAALASDSNS
ncbi:response regulator [Dongia sp.]|uniref:response regulator n=1 Tax=Dongia sp. TaxID=1977262 RepID=UPI003750F03B